jgi:lysophospholipase L1-like esterase
MSISFSTLADPGPGAALPGLAVKDPVTVLSIGDSMTEGYIDGVVDHEHRFTSILERLLTGETPSSRVVNRGKSGQTSSEGAVTMSGYLFSDKPDIVTILYGTNDMLLEADGIPRVSPFNCGEALRFMVREARAEGVVPVLMTLVPVVLEKYYLRHDRELYEKYGGAEALRQRYDLTVRRIAGEEDVVLIDLEELLGPDLEVTLGDDGVHLSVAGHQMIGEELMETISGLVLPPGPGDDDSGHSSLGSSYVYPNPFRLSSGALLKVHVTVAGSCILKARVFDITGKCIAVLSDAVFEHPGDHWIVWDGMDKKGNPVPPGIYLLSLELVPKGSADSVRKVIKVAVLR